MADIWFTSDTHSYLYPTDYISKKKQDMGYIALSSSFTAGAIIVDGGDMLQGSPLVRYEMKNAIRPFLAAEVFNRVGLGIYVPGNHDFNFGYDVLSSFLSSLKAEKLAANVVDDRGELGLKRYALIEAADGIRILFVGVVTDYVNIWESRKNLEGLRITDSVKAAEEALKEGSSFSPDYTVCVYHGGFGDEEGEIRENRGAELAALGFDILLTGHQHAIIEPKHIGRTLTLQAGAKAMFSAHIMLGHDGKIDAELVKTDASLPLRSEFCDLSGKEEEAVMASLAVPIGNVNGSLIDASKLESAIHGSSLADFLNDMQLEFTGADISAVSLFNEPYSLGPVVTLGDILAAYPFSNTLLKIRLTGRMLRQAMERSAGYFEIEDGKVRISDRFIIPKEEHYNYDFYRGISYSFDISRKLGERVVRLVWNNINLLENPDTQLTMALNSYRATGTGGYGIYRSAEVIEHYSQDVQDLLIDRFSDGPAVDVPVRTDFLLIR